MAETAAKGGSRIKKKTPAEITFKCRLCEKEKPISEMKIVTRFRPVMVVCQDCEKTLR